MRSTYNNKKIMAAIAAAAMFGVGPAMAATQVYVDNATSTRLTQVTKFHDLADCSTQSVNVGDGNVVAAYQSYVKLADAKKYTCESMNGSYKSKNQGFENVAIGSAIVNGSTLEVKIDNTVIKCPENYRLNGTTCEEVVYSYAPGSVEYKNATCSGSNNSWSAENQSCGKNVQETCADKEGYTNSGKCYATRTCPAGYPFERNNQCNSKAPGSFGNKTANYVYSDEITLKTNWQSSGPANCSSGYVFIDGANTLINACIRTTCPTGYEASGLLGDDACRAYNKPTGKTTSERVYETTVEHYEGCSATVAKSEPNTGDVVKYAEADTAFCALGTDKAFTLIGSSNGNGVAISVNNAVATLKNADISATGAAAITVSEGANVTVKFEGTENRLQGAEGFAGIAKTGEDGILTVDGTSAKNVINITGGNNAAGIGGNNGQTTVKGIKIIAGNITVNGGNNGGAGIGGGEGGSAYNITIGGDTDSFKFTASDKLTLTAHGRDGGAGIGGGARGAAENLVFNDGFVYAEAHADQYATAAIGAGYDASCKDIIFNNGVIKANGGKASSGIGADGQSQTKCSGIVINNGSINAQAGTGANLAKAIGKTEPVTITGGSIKASDANAVHYEDIVDPVDAQGQTVHLINVPATYNVGASEDFLFIRSTEKNKLGAAADIELKNVYIAGGDWDNGKFYPTHHMSVGANDPEGNAYVFLGENEEHDLMVNPSVTGDDEKVVTSSGKTSRIKWDAKSFIYNFALLNSYPHDVLVYNGYEQSVVLDDAEIWMLNKFVKKEEIKNFALGNEKLTNANVSCSDTTSRSVDVEGKIANAPLAKYCKVDKYLEGADSLYKMTTDDVRFYGFAQHKKMMLPYILDNMDFVDAEKQFGDNSVVNANDPIKLKGGYDTLVYNGVEQTQVIDSIILDNAKHYPNSDFKYYKLVAGSDYAIKEGTNKGTQASKLGMIEINAKGNNFYGTAHRNFVIDQFDLAKATLKFNPDSLVYNMKEQTQMEPLVYLCDAEKVGTDGCYLLKSSETNTKDIASVSGNVQVNAGEYLLSMVVPEESAGDCGEPLDFCSNVKMSRDSAYRIAKFPADSLKIAFASADQDTMVYDGTVRPQLFKTSLKTLYKEPVEVAEDAEEGAPTFKYVEVSGLSASSTVVTNHAEFDTTGNKATDAGEYTLTITAKTDANFEGFKNYVWKIGARDLAGNVWQRSQRNPENPTSQNNVATICENYQKCVEAADGFTPSADVAKYGCRAVYPCDWGYEKYDPATMTLASTAQTYNAQWQENAVTSVKSKGLDVTYSVMTAKAISDHEADSVYQEKEVPSNRHLNVNGRDPVNPYCVKHTVGAENAACKSSPMGMGVMCTEYYGKDEECTKNGQNWIVNIVGKSGTYTCQGEVKVDMYEGCKDIRSNEVSEVEDINVAVEGTGNFKGIQHTAYKMNPYKVENVTINLGDALTFNGETQTQIVKDISIGDNFKVSGTNFTDNFIITDNTGKDAGNGYKLTIIGKKNYKGEQSKEWSIAKFDITSAEITPVFDKELTYNPKSSQQTQKVNSATVKIGDADVDLTFSSSSMTQAFDAGDYSITLIGNGNFTGSKAVTFNVARFNIETEMVDGEKFVVTMTDKDYQPGTKPNVTIENPILVYNGSEQEQHFAVTAGAIVLNPENYTVTGNKATNVGSQRIVVEGIGNFIGRVECVNPWTIAKQGQVLVTVALKDSNTVYNGQEFTFGGADIIKSATFTKFGEEGEPQTFDIANLVIDPSVIVKGTNAGEYKFDDATLAGIKINGNYEACEEDAGCGVQFNGSATLKIAKAPVTVAVAGKTENVTFDNEEHKFAGYDVTIPEAWTEFLKAESFSCTECDSVAGKDAGEYALGLAKEKFANANGNFDVTFDVTDGKLVIDPATVQIKLYGNTKEVTFNGERQEVSGFSVPKFIDGNQDFVTLDDIKYTGDTSVSAVDAGIYEMVIDPALFSSANKNFNIEVTEFTNGKLTIKPAPIDVKITGNTDSKYYAARKFTVSGYDVKIEGDIEKAPFSKSDIALVNGAVAEVSAENVKMDGGKVAKYMMGLKKENFASRNQNYDVNFTVVADGYLEIKPVDIVVNIVGNIDSVKYNGKSQSVEGVSITANDPNFGVNDYTYTGATKASAKEGVVELKVDKSKFKLTNDNYNVTSFITKNGYIKVVKTDAIQTVLKSDVKVRAIESGIVVDNANGKAISVFTMNGKTVYSSMRGANTFGSTTISVPKGMYIVKVGSAAQRVNVK